MAAVFLEVVRNKNIKIILNYVAGPLLMVLLLYIVTRQLQQQPDWKQSLANALVAIRGPRSWCLYAMIVLMGANWGLEAAKWRIAIRPVQSIPYSRALKAVFAGTCIASFTPNRVGEYLGRILFIDPGNKIRTIAPTVVCSMAQMFVTLLAGAAGLSLLHFRPPVFPVFWTAPHYLAGALFIVLVAALFLLLIYFRSGPLIRIINPWIRKWKPDLAIPAEFPGKSLRLILIFSTVRYLVFLTQYILLFRLFGIATDPLSICIGVSVMFLLMAAIPTLTFFTDLGFRWEAGIQIFRVYTVNTAGILAVSLGIWMINLIIPALIGSLLILRIKLFREA